MGEKFKKELNMKEITIYHKNCMDGLSSAYLMTKMNKNITTIPMTYNDNIDELLGDNIMNLQT